MHCRIQKYQSSRKNVISSGLCGRLTEMKHLYQQLVNWVYCIIFCTRPTPMFCWFGIITPIRLAVIYINVSVTCWLIVYIPGKKCYFDMDSTANWPRAKPRYTGRKCVYIYNPKTIHLLYFFGFWTSHTRLAVIPTFLAWVSKQYIHNV